MNTELALTRQVFDGLDGSQRTVRLAEDVEEGAVETRTAVEAMSRHVVVSVSLDLLLVFLLLLLRVNAGL